MKGTPPVIRKRTLSFFLEGGPGWLSDGCAVTCPGLPRVSPGRGTTDTVTHKEGTSGVCRTLSSHFHSGCSPGLGAFGIVPAHCQK